MSDVKVEAKIGLYSFSTRGTNPKTQFEFDVSKLRDPQGQKQFGGMVGTREEIQKWIAEDPKVAALIQNCRILAADLLRVHSPSTEPRSNWVSFSFKDFHGKWISPAVTELVAEALRQDGWPVTVHHLSLRGK